MSQQPTIEDLTNQLKAMRTEMGAEINQLRTALNIETARVDFLWERAMSRHAVPEEDFAVAQDPARLALRS